MTTIKAVLRSQAFSVIALLILVSGLAYLPFIGQFGYFNDDWYLMYAAGAKGAFVFKDIFSIDRPLRALVMVPAYFIFGENPFGFNLSAYGFRVLSALGFLWLLRTLWPRQRTAGMLMALLFLIYPGFLSQFNGIDYQSQMVSLAAAVFSLALTVKAIQADGLAVKIILFFISGVLSWLYIGLVEYFIGFEIIRLACVFLLVSREHTTPGKKIIQAVRQWLPSLILLLPFLVWRLYFFESERSATDIGLQLDRVVQSPLTTSLRWLTTLLSDSLDVVVLAWGQPLSSLLSWISTRNQLLLGLGLSTVSIVIFLFVLRQLEGPEGSETSNWRSEAFWFGAVGVIGGLFPIVLVNRYVDFGSYSRYTLVSSAGAVILLVSLVFSLQKQALRNIILAGFVLVASFTHFANSQKAVQINNATRDFWWQIYWRAPQISPHTTLIANYAVGATEEDYFVWGPANMIYYPDGTKEKYVQPGVYAAVLNRDTVTKVLVGKGQEFDNRRTIRTYKNYRRLLVLTQPTVNSCVHVIDGTQPEYSTQENASIQIIGQNSDLDYILTDVPAPVLTPPAIVFGQEPEHDWCYYYQKATLSRQRGDWDEVLILGEDALNKGLAPVDLIEWLPFLQAYARAGDIDRLVELAPIVSSDPYIVQQACRGFGEISDLAKPVFDVIDLQYCNE
jgi:hypothetical protein